MSRMQDARAGIKQSVALDEYKARMGGYLDAALTLIDVAATDALQNFQSRPEDIRTQQVVMALATAKQSLEPLVAILCPLTTNQPLPVAEAADHG